MSTYSVGQMNQLGDALERAEFTPDDVTKLRSFAELGKFKDVLNGSAQILRVIDLDADPSVPDGWEVVEHIKGGKRIEWDPVKVTLYLSEGQQNGKLIKGYKLREELKDKPVFNANLLDHWLKNPECIPDECKGKLGLFWGTVYRRRRGGGLYVRCFGWFGRQQYDGFRLLSGNFGSRSPAVVPANS